MSDGPWKIQDTGSGLFVQRTERATYFDEEQKDQAQKLCDELNKIARREAASEQLLEACKAASLFCAMNGLRNTGLHNACRDAIRAAEGEEKDQ